MMLDAYFSKRLAAVAVLLSLAGGSVGLLAHYHHTFPLDDAVSSWARGLGSGVGPVSRAINEGNSAIAFATVGTGIAVMLWRRYPAGALIFALAALARPFLNDLKSFVDRPRPSGDFSVLDTVRDSSFPSGHTMTAVVFFGLWIALVPVVLPRRLVFPARVIFMIVIAAYGVSRMWAGVHWFSDTWGAVIWGGALVAVLLAIRPGLELSCQKVGGGFNRTDADR